MTRRLEVPPALLARAVALPLMRPWCAALPGIAAELLDRWDLRPDGVAWSGFNAAVWPVLDAGGSALVLKVGCPDPMTVAEAEVLQQWDGRGAVRCLRVDDAVGALLLERLDGDRSLADQPDVDQACTVVGELLAGLPDRPPPARVRTVADEALGLARTVRLGAAADPTRLPARVVGAALETLDDLAATGRSGSLLHADAHFLNVLRTRDGTGWRLIDPLPAVGPREWELIPLLRNRWDDAVATGDPGRALRRRVDLICSLLGADPARARALAQAAGAAAVLDVDRDPVGDPFLPSYRELVTWLT